MDTSNNNIRCFLPRFLIFFSLFIFVPTLPTPPTASHRREGNTTKNMDDEKYPWMVGGGYEDQDIQVPGSGPYNAVMQNAEQIAQRPVKYSFQQQLDADWRPAVKFTYPGLAAAAPPAPGAPVVDADKIAAALASVAASSSLGIQPPSALNPDTVAAVLAAVAAKAAKESGAKTPPVAAAVAGALVAALGAKTIPDTETLDTSLDLSAVTTSVPDAPGAVAPDESDESIVDTAMGAALPTALGSDIYYPVDASSTEKDLRAFIERHMPPLGNGPGVYFMGAALMGVTAPLFAVVETISGTPPTYDYEGVYSTQKEAQRNLHLQKKANKKRKLAVRCVWFDKRAHDHMDLCYPSDTLWHANYRIEAHFLRHHKATGAHSLSDHWRRYYESDRSNEDEREDLIQRVEDMPLLPDIQASLEAVTASVTAVADAAREAGAFVMSDFLADDNLLAERRPDEFRDWVELIKHHDPLGIFNNKVRVDTMVLYVNKRNVELVKQNRNLFRCKKLLVFECNTTSKALRHNVIPRQFGPMLFSALSRERCSVSVACSPGAWTLERMAQCADRDLPMVVLEGSGRYANIWSELWTQHASTTFDPLKVQKMLDTCSDYGKSSVLDVKNVRIVLRQAVLSIYKFSQGYDALHGLVLASLKKDVLVEQARVAHARYERTGLRYVKWYHRFFYVVLILSFAATVLALTLNDTETSIFLLILIPVLVTFFESVERYFNAATVSVACERAAGLVDKELYFYRTRTLDYSDVKVQSKALLEGSTPHNVRTDQFNAVLFNINLAVEASGAACRTVEPCDDDIPDILDGTQYVKHRVKGKIPLVGWTIRKYKWGGMALHWAKYMAVAVGTILGVLQRVKWVALTIAFNVMITRILLMHRVQTMREANGKAALMLEEMETWWESLCPEEKKQQKNLDTLVDSVEQALEDTLPGAPELSKK